MERATIVRQPHQKQHMVNQVPVSQRIMEVMTWDISRS